MSERRALHWAKQILEIELKVKSKVNKEIEVFGTGFDLEPYWQRAALFFLT